MAFVLKILGSEPEFNSPDQNNIVLDLNGTTSTVTHRFMASVSDDVEFDIGSTALQLIGEENNPIEAKKGNRTITFGLIFQPRNSIPNTDFSDVVYGIDLLDDILKESTEDYIRESSGGFSMVKPGKRYWLLYSPNDEVETPKCFLLKTGSVDRKSINNQIPILQNTVTVNVSMTTSYEIFDDLRYLLNGVSNGTWIYGQKYWTSSVWVTDQTTNYKGWNLGLDLTGDVFDLTRPGGSYPYNYTANVADPTYMNYGLEYLVAKTVDGGSPFNATFVSHSDLNGSTVTLTSRDIQAFSAARFDKHRFMFGFQFRNIKSGNANDVLSAKIEVYNSNTATWSQFGTTISCGGSDGAVGTWVTKSWNASELYNLPYINPFSWVKPKFRVVFTPKNTSAEWSNNSGFSIRHVGLWIFPPNEVSTNEFGNLTMKSKFDYDLTFPSEYISVPGNWNESSFMFNTKGTLESNLRLTLNPTNSFNAGGSSSWYYMDETIVGIRKYDRMYAHTVYTDFISQTTSTATGSLDAAATSDRTVPFNNTQIAGILPPNQSRYKIFFEAMSGSYLWTSIDYAYTIVPNPTQFEIQPTANLINTANLIDCGMLVLPRNDIHSYIGSDGKEFLANYGYFYLNALRSPNSSSSTFGFVFQNLWLLPAEQIAYLDLGRDGTYADYVTTWSAKYASSEQTSIPFTIDSLYCQNSANHYVGHYFERYHSNLVNPRGNIDCLYIHGTEGSNKYPTQIAYMTKESGSNLPQKLFHMIPTVVYAPAYRV